MKRQIDMIRLRNSSSRLDIIQKITAELTSTLDFQEVLHQIVRTTAEAMSVKGVALRLLDEKSRQFNLAAAWGLSEEYLDKGPVIADVSMAEGMAGDIVHIPNVTSDARIQYPSQAAAEGIVSILSVPMVLRNKTVGVLRLYTGELRHFSDEESEFVRTLANLGALAIEYAKSF